MLVEQSPVPASVLPLDAFRDHLKLGTGFSAAAVQDGLLEANLRAALAVVENRTGKAVLIRAFQWTVQAWRDLSFQVLPVAPVVTIDGFQIVDRSGTVSVVDAGDFALQVDAHRPALKSKGFCLPTIPVGGSAEIAFTAGYGADWDGVPADLAQAVLGIAAHFYENRSAHGVGETEVPAHLMSLLGPYRNLRMFGWG